MRGGVLVWIRHVASRCYASFPKQPCQWLQSWVTTFTVTAAAWALFWATHLLVFPKGGIFLWWVQQLEDHHTVHFQTNRFWKPCLNFMAYHYYRTEMLKYIICHYIYMMWYCYWTYLLVFGKGQSLAVSFCSYFWRLKGCDFQILFSNPLVGF